MVVVLNREGKETKPKVLRFFRLVKAGIDVKLKQRREEFMHLCIGST